MRLTQQIIIKILPLFFALAFVACDSNVWYIEKEVLPEYGWCKDSNVHFEVAIEDTLQPVNFYIMLRNMGSYPFANLYLFMQTTFPNGEVSTDTLNCPLADNKGNWLGKGLGDIKTQELLFMRNVRFVQAGNYRFEFQQGMRKDTLLGVYEMGIKIEKP